MFQRLYRSVSFFSMILGLSSLCGTLLISVTPTLSQAQEDGTVTSLTGDDQALPIRSLTEIGLNQIDFDLSLNMDQKSIGGRARFVIEPTDAPVIVRIDLSPSEITEITTGTDHQAATHVIETNKEDSDGERSQPRRLLHLRLPKGTSEFQIVYKKPNRESSNPNWFSNFLHTLPKGIISNELIQFYGLSLSDWAPFEPAQEDHFVSTNVRINTGTSPMKVEVTHLRQILDHPVEGYDEFESVRPSNLSKMALVAFEPFDSAQGRLHGELEAFIHPTQPMDEAAKELLLLASQSFATFNQEVSQKINQLLANGASQLGLTAISNDLKNADKDTESDTSLGSPIRIHIIPHQFPMAYFAKGNLILINEDHARSTRSFKQLLIQAFYDLIEETMSDHLNLLLMTKATDIPGISIWRRKEVVRRAASSSLEEWLQEKRPLKWDHLDQDNRALGLHHAEDSEASRINPATHLPQSSELSRVAEIFRSWLKSNRITFATEVLKFNPSQWLYLFRLMEFGGKTHLFPKMELRFSLSEVKGHSARTSSHDPQVQARWIALGIQKEVQKAINSSGTFLASVQHPEWVISIYRALLNGKPLTRRLATIHYRNLRPGYSVQLQATLDALFEETKNSNSGCLLAFPGSR